MDIKYLWVKFLKKARGSAIKNSIIHSTSKVESGCNIVNVHMGKYSFCGYDCEIICTVIGSFCSIANNVVIGGAVHPMNWVSTSPVFYKGRDSVKKKFSEHILEEPKETTIGHDVWIGQGSFIKQGVRIGNGAIIGMGSVVTKDVLPYSIVGGVPAKLIRKRFEENLIEEILKSEWWNLPESQLKKYSQWIKDPKMFLKKIDK